MHPSESYSNPDFQKASIFLIYTGGTIGMKEDSKDRTLKPFDFKHIIDKVPEIGRFASKIDSYTFDPLIDSSDVEPASWQILAKLIKDKYDKYDGFVILHGTDTMSYSASALSFMLDNLQKPIIFTGSQLPIGAPRTDGKENIISSVEIAATRDANGRAIVPEVCIYFDSMLMRGNRTVKINSEEFRAFVSPNFPVLADAGIYIKYKFQNILKASDKDSELIINSNLDTRVSILKLHPGITPRVCKYILCSPETRAVIIETYGSGNAPSRDWFLDILREANSLGKIMVNVTQCVVGTVNMSIYATGKTLEDCGVINGYDSTTEAALGKLFVLMGKSSDNEWVKKMMHHNLKGEISTDHFSETR